MEKEKKMTMNDCKMLVFLNLAMLLGIQLEDDGYSLLALICFTITGVLAFVMLFLTIRDGIINRKKDR